MLTAKQISFEYADAQVLKSTSLSISAGDKIGLVGSNGAGKSTLLRILAGQLEATEGAVLRPSELNVGYVPQEISSYAHYSGLEFIEEVTAVRAALNGFDAAVAQYGSSADTSVEANQAYELAYNRVEALGAYTLETRLAKALSRVGLQEDLLAKKVRQMSGGQKTKLALAAVLLAQFDVFLLDEPTNNLDLEGLAVLGDFVARSTAAFVVVSHDRAFLRSATNKIAELGTDGQIHVYSLGYDEFVEAKRKDREAAEQRYEQYQEEKKRLQVAATEKSQAAQSAAAYSRASDNEKIGRNARKERAVGSHARAAASLTTRLAQLKEPTRPQAEMDLNFRFSTEAAKLPSVALDLRDGVVVFDDLQLGPYSLQVKTGDKLVILGSNGGGKSVLLRILAGHLKLQSGSLSCGSGIKVGYIDQDYSFARDDRSVLEQLQSDAKVGMAEALNVLAHFGITREKANALPAELSPGQRARVKLACLVARGVNLLLLDEPTNHLDVAMSDELQAALAAYRGTLLVVSHDRELIAGIGSSNMVVVKDGVIAPNDVREEYVRRFLGDERPR